MRKHSNIDCLGRGERGEREEGKGEQSSKGLYNKILFLSIQESLNLCKSGGRRRGLANLLSKKYGEP